MNISVLECPLCGFPLEVKLTAARGKPYTICRRCGLSLFVRGRQGINRLLYKLKVLEAPLARNQEC